MLQVEAVAVELGDGAGGDEDAGRVATGLEEVEGGEEGLADGGGEAVVRRGVEGEEVDCGLGLGDGDGAAGMGAEGRDGDGEEGFGHFELDAMDIWGVGDDMSIADEMRDERWMEMTEEKWDGLSDCGDDVVWGNYIKQVKIK